MINRKALEK
jgi:hypothetical protein